MLILVPFESRNALCNAHSSACKVRGRGHGAKGILVWKPGGGEHYLFAATGEWMVPKKERYIFCADLIDGVMGKAVARVADAAKESRWHLGFGSLTPISE